MKILHISPSYKPAYIYGGPIQSVGKLCEVLKRSNDQRLKPKDNLQVFTTTANGKHELDVETRKPQIVDGVPVTYFKRLTKDHSHFSPALLINLRDVLRQAQHDKDVIVIHIHAWWNLVSLLSCWLAKWYDIPVILSPRGMLTTYTQWNRNSLAKKIIHELIGKHLLRYCHIHATSDQEKQDVLKIVKPQSIRVIPNLVSIKYSIPKSEYKAAKQNIKLIFLSRIEEKKGLELLFEALTLLEFPWLLTLAGSGADDYVKSLKQKGERLNISERILWMGQVSNEKKFDLLAEHDLCVLTSHNENFANVVVESLSVGTAVLISDKVGLSKYVKEKNFGWVAPLDVKEIRNLLILASEDDAKLNLIRCNAPQIIRTDFNDEVLVSKYLQLYKNTITPFE